jgi:hypothetical protein
LDKMVSVPADSASWKGISKFESFLEHVLLGKQSLSHINLALPQEKDLLEEKMAAAVARQVELKDEATATTGHADLIVARATNTTSHGLAAANPAQLAHQQNSALNARRNASDAILAFRRVQGHGQGVEVIPPVDAVNGNQGNQLGNPVVWALTLSRDLQRQANIAAEVSSLQAAAVANSAATAADAHAALCSCSNLIEACDLGINAFGAMSTAVTNKLTDIQEQGVLQVAEAHVLEEARILALQSAVRTASPHIKLLANRVRSSLQVVNATTGIPPTLREALRLSQEQMLVLKKATDSLFLGRKVKTSLRILICKCGAGNA